MVLGVLICCWTAPTYGQVPTGDSVVGQGQTRPFGSLGVEWSFEFEAHSGPSGEDPSGLVDLGFRLQSMPSNFVHLEGHVTCLSVSGNDAVVGFEVDPPGAFGFTGVIVHVVDNGPAGSDPPDTVRPVSVNDPTSCDLSPIIPVLDVVEGDVTVTDAPALPASRSQCLNGGWRAFPGFKNQGQCIAFVNRGP